MFSINTAVLPISRFRYIFQSHWFALFFVFLLSLSITLMNNSWIFTTTGWLDPWMNVGYAYTFNDKRFGGDLKTYYKISRVPWLYLEYIVRKCFSPLGASYFLQYSCLSVSVIAIYSVVRRLLGAIPALVAATILSIYPEFLACGGADYQNTLAGPLYALCFLVLTIAAQSDRKTTQWLILFGFIYATLIHTVVLYINFIPILFFHFYFVRKSFSRDPISFRNLLIFSSSGILISTCFWGGISRLYGYKFLFFMNQTGVIGRFLCGQWMSSPWWRSWESGWFFNASWMGPLAAGMLFSIGALIISYKKKNNTITDRLAHHLNFQFVFLGLIWVLWQSTKKDMLNTPYFAYLLIIPFVISIAANFSLYVRNRSLNSLLPVILCVTTIACVYFNFHVFCLQYFQVSLFVLTLCCFLTAFVFYKIHAITSMVCLGLACSILWSQRPYSILARDSYLAILEASRWVYSTCGSTKEVFAWFDSSEQNQSPLFKDVPISVAYGGLLSCIQDPFPMPTIQNLDLKVIKQNLSRRKEKVVVLLTEDVKHVDEMRSRLDLVDIHMDLVQTHEVHVGDIHIPMYVLKESLLQTSFDLEKL